jgi:hypothetical protein
MQAWLQLAANAARHSTPGGSIELVSRITTSRPTEFTHATGFTLATPRELGEFSASTSADTGHGDADDTTATATAAAPAPSVTALDRRAAVGLRVPGADEAPAERWLCLSARAAATPVIS